MTQETKLNIKDIANLHSAISTLYRIQTLCDEPELEKQIEKEMKAIQKTIKYLQETL